MKFNLKKEIINIKENTKINKLELINEINEISEILIQNVIDYENYKLNNENNRKCEYIFIFIF